MPESAYEYNMAESGWRRVCQECLGRREVCMVFCTILLPHLPFSDVASRLVAAVFGPMKVKVVAPSFAAPALVRSKYWICYLHAC